MTGRTILITFILIGLAVVVSAKRPPFRSVSNGQVRPIGSVLLSTETPTVRQGDTTKEIELNVRDDNGERTIKFSEWPANASGSRNIS
jgi:hypothetical protein